MKLLIDIPKEFEQHFQEDGFDDSLHRLSADAHLLAGIYEQETAFMLSEVFKNAVHIPPHGDLIDRDALLKGDGRYIISFGKEGIDVAEISRAPTIIPAESPKEEE